MIVYFCYPPAFIGYALQHTIDRCINLPLTFNWSDSVIFKYLSFVLWDGVIHFPSVFRKDLAILEGEDLLQRVGDECVSYETVQSFSVRVNVEEGYSPAHWKQETQILSALRKWTSWECPPSVCVQIVDYACPAERQSRRSWSSSGVNSSLCKWVTGIKPLNTVTVMFPLCCWGHIMITVLDSAVCTAGMTRSPSSGVAAEHFHTSHSPCKQAHRTHHRGLMRFQSFLHGSLPQGAGRVQMLAPRKQIHIYTTKIFPLPMNSFFF